MDAQPRRFAHLCPTVCPAFRHWPGLFCGSGQYSLGSLFRPVPHLADIRGSIALAMVAASSAGPFIMGATYDLFGSYEVSLTLFIILLIPLAIAALWATPPKLPQDRACRCQECSLQPSLITIFEKIWTIPHCALVFTNLPQDQNCRQFTVIQTP